MADIPGTGNTAGELNVKFTANTAPLKEAAADVKTDLQGVGEEGKSAGAGVAGGMAMAAAGAVAASAAVIKVMDALAALNKEAEAFERNRRDVFAAQESLLSSLLNLAQQNTDYDRQRAHINQQLANTNQAISDEYAKQLEGNHNLIGQAGMLLGISKSQSELLKEQNYDLQEAARYRDLQVQALNEATAKQAELNNRLKQAAQTGDSINVEKERARQEIEALERKRDSLSGAGSYAALGELNEAIRLRKLELEDTIKRIKAEREAKAIRDMENASAQALAEARREMREKDREEREAQREHEREMANLARERLRVEREITRERNQQQSGFGLGNVNFSSGRAMQAAIGQAEISQRWSD